MNKFDLESDKLKLNEIALKAYQAYGKVTDFKNFRGEPMPLFEELPEKIQLAWVAAAKSVLSEIADIDN